MSENEQNIPENTPIPPENTTTTTETVVITERFIDVQKVFSQKSPRLARWIPWFVFNYLRRIIHEKQVNAFLYEHRDDDAKTYSRAVRDYFKLDVVIHGAENLPLTGRCIAASNHPLGGLDGILLMDLIGQLRTDLQVVVNDLLMNIPQLRPYFIPINKHGSNKENLTIFNKAFADENIILYFPAGLVSRKQKKTGFIRDLEWQPTFLKKAVQTKRDIIPIHVGGKNSNFFYNLANFRKWIGIKGNIEMLYLVDEMFHQMGKTIPITIGKPISYQRFDKSKTMLQWAEDLRQYIYVLGENPDAVF
jgi:putative hemolysin